MSARPKDHRPKVISFRTTLDGLNIAARRDILWPCHAFNVSIPQKKKSGLNVFEETVLKITEIESGDTDKIVLLTCLEKELVSFIQNRLNQLGLLDDRYELSEHGRKVLHEWQNKSDGNLEYTVATVFVDLLSGKLLSYVSTKQLRYKKIVRIGGNKFVEFLIIPTKEKSKIHAIPIHPTEDSYWKTVPDSSDIIRAIKEFKKNYKRHALLSQGIEQYPPPVPMAEAISLYDNPELVYLHCKILIQIGNSDLLVTDGCGFGFSESFANYLTENADKDKFRWVKKFKEQGVVKTLEGDSDDQGIKRNKSWAFPEITKRFYDSHDGKILGIYSLLKSLTDSPSTTAEEKYYIEKRQQSISKLYAALEWALRYAVHKYPVDDWEQLYKSQNFKDNEKILCGFAEKTGFSVTPKNRSILQLKAGAIRQIERGKVELQPLLAIAITGAAAKYVDHPFHALVENHSNFLSFVIKLKRMRDPIEHGDISDFEADSERLNGISDKTKDVITTLLPSIISEFDRDSGKITESYKNINQERLKAEIQLEKALGVAFLSKISPGIKEQLTRGMMLMDNFSNDKSQQIVSCVYSIMQLSLFEIEDNCRSSEKNRIDPREEAIGKIVQSGFYHSSYALPKQISTVSKKQLHSALHGASATLGAHLLSVFLIRSGSELIQLRKSDPSFIEFVANVIHLRGHGNKRQHDFSKDDMESLKNDVFKAIKIITEVF